MKLFIIIYTQYNDNLFYILIILNSIFLMQWSFVTVYHVLRTGGFPSVY